MGTNTKHPVLVVDDEAEVLYSLRALLRKDYEFHSASNSFEAFQTLEQQPIHVVMADQIMPGMTGVDFLAAVRSQYPAIIRLIFTGYADIRAVIDSINQGHVYRYIAKPWDEAELRLVLRQACDLYDQAAERQRLLTDLQSYLERCLTLMQGLTAAPAGLPKAAERAAVAQFAQAASQLLDRLNRSLLPPHGPASR